MRRLRNPYSVMRRATSVKEAPQICVCHRWSPASVTASVQPLHLEKIILLIPLFYFIV